MFNQQSKTPLKLILEKYKGYMDKNCKTHETSLCIRMAKVLLQKGAKIEISCSDLEIAVNIPPILDDALLKCHDLIEKIPKMVKHHFKEKIVSMGFFDLMLEHCPRVISTLTDSDNCHEFLNNYKDGSGQTALHSAAKSFKPSIVKSLMEIRRYVYLHSKDFKL